MMVMMIMNKISKDRKFYRVLETWLPESLYNMNGCDFSFV